MDVQTDTATLYGNNSYNDNADLYMDDVPALVPADYPYTNRLVHKMFHFQLHIFFL